jgi:putative DNA primase/helicase
MNSPIQQFRDAIQAAGIVPPDAIKADGKLWRFPTNGKPDDVAGWYVFHLGSIPVGTFGDWREGSSHKWRADIGRSLTREEEKEHRNKLEAMKHLRQAEQSKQKEEARERATLIWDKALPCPTHPYLKAKDIKASGARLYEDALVIPIREGGKLHSLQFIDPNGNKKFLAGGRVAGCYCSIGKPTGGDALCIVEGFATGASVHAATGLPVAVAFNAGNLAAVAKAMRGKFPDLPIVLCADDDFNTDGNPGRTKAAEAALAVDGVVAIPYFGDNRPDGATDFNDMIQLCGKDAVTTVLSSAAEQARANREAQAKNSAAGEYHLNVELLCASDLDPQPISWLCNGWLAQGKVHILGGAPGAGKTTISIALAAIVTTGGVWPDGSRCPIVGNVVIWSGEDDPADTLVPRLELAGADRARVYFVDAVREGNEKRSFDPARDVQPLQRKLAEIGEVCLLIIDPIVSAIAGDSHKNAEVRRGLQPLADLAAATGCALLGITHFSKGTGGRDPLERITGSLAFGAVPRVVMVAAKNQEENDGGEDKRLLLRAKSNIGPDDGGFEYQLTQSELKTTPGIWASKTVWGRALEGEARDLLASADVNSVDTERGALSDAKAFLRGILAWGSQPSAEIEKRAMREGYSEATLKRAKKALHIESFKIGGNFGGGKQQWMWELPPAEGAQGAQGAQRVQGDQHEHELMKSPLRTEDGQQKSMSPFSKLEPLQEDIIEEEI